MPFLTLFLSKFSINKVYIISIIILIIALVILKLNYDIKKEELTNKEIENAFIQSKLDIALSVNKANLEKLNILQQNIEANNKAEENLNSLKRNIELNNKKLSSKIDTINYSSGMQYLTAEELSILRDISNPKEGETK